MLSTFRYYVYILCNYKKIRLSSLCVFSYITYHKIPKFTGINTLRYTADLGDTSKNELEKCFCTAPDNCLTKNLYDMTKCLGVPIISSLPHFYGAEENWLQMVDGLHPNQVTSLRLYKYIDYYIILIELITLNKCNIQLNKYNKTCDCC